MQAFNNLLTILTITSEQSRRYELVNYYKHRYLFFVVDVYIFSLSTSATDASTLVTVRVPTTGSLDATRHRLGKRNRRGERRCREETRGSALSHSCPALENLSFGSRGPARCILICTLTDSFPILIYKQITPLFKFPRGNTRRRSSP